MKQKNLNSYLLAATFAFAAFIVYQQWQAKTTYTVNPPVTQPQPVQPAPVQILIDIAAPLVDAAKDTGNAVALPPVARPALDQGGPMVNLSTGQMARQTAEFVLACWEAEQRGEFYDAHCPAEAAEVLGVGR